MKHFAYRTVSKLCRAAGWPGPKPGQRVLLYHAVGTEIPGDPYGLSLAPEAFARQLDLLKSLSDEFIPAPFGAPPSDRREVAVVFDDGFRDTLTTAAPQLAGRGIPFTVFVTAGFVKDGSPIHLTPAQLRELSAVPGATIGAHGLRHVRLDRASDAELGHELTESRRYLEDAIGKPVVTMSYPHGAVDRRVASAAKGAGYLHAGCSRYGLNGPGRDPLLLCRTEITASDSLDDFELKLRGHWDWFQLRHADPAAS